MKKTLLTVGKIIDAIATLALAVLIIYTAYAKYYLSYSSVLIAISLILGGLVCSFMCDILHEAGHLLFGALCDFSFNSIHIGFIKIYKSCGKIRCTVKELPGSIAGMTEMLPKNSDNLHKRFLRMVAGGLLFSCLVFLALAMCFVFNWRLPFVVYVLTCTGLPYAFHLFFYNFLPLDNENLFTDGALLWGLIYKDNSYMTAVNILAVEGYMNLGYTPGQIDKKLYFGLPQLPEDDFNFIILTSYRLMYYIDTCDNEKAAAASDRLSNLLEYVPGIYYKDIASDILFCECYIKGNIAEASKLYPTLENYLKREDNITSHRILAAYELYVNNDKKAALNHLNAGEMKAEVNGITGLVGYEKKLIHCIREDIIKENP